MNQLLSLFFRSSIGVLLAACLLWQSSPAQEIAPKIEWQKSLGGSDGDYATSIAQTSDGGYIVAGWSESTDGDVSGNHGFYDYWIVKLTSAGAMEWQKSLGGAYQESVTSISQTLDSGYIVAGSSRSIDGNVTGNHDLFDFWIVKLTSEGMIQWQKSLGGSGSDIATSIEQTSDGGYIVAGWSESTDGDVTRPPSLYKHNDYWIVKLTTAGVIEWQKSFGGSGNDAAYSIQQTSDGGYIIAGSSTSNDRDVTEHHGAWDYFDYWIVKITNAGVIEWQKSFGGSSNEYANSIEQTSDGGYIVAGWSQSTNGDVSGNYGFPGTPDYWIVKLTSMGRLEWQKLLGGSKDDRAYSIKQIVDGGYIVAGYSESDEGNVRHHGSTDSSDAWIVNLTSAGDIMWQKSLGGSGNDYASSIEQTRDGGYIVAGTTYSNNGDVIGRHKTSNYPDFWIVKLAPSNSTGVKPTESPIPNPWAMNANYPNPFSSTTTITFTVPERSFVRLSVDTEQGVEVARLIEEHLEAGEYRVPFSAEGLASGTYLYRLTSGSTSLVGKMTVVR